MKALRWFQTKVGLFQDPRMMYLLSQPYGDSYFVIWFYLKDLAGMINDDGYIYVSERQAMPTELLARQLRRRKAFVERVLDVFEQIDLISRDETGLIRLVPWDEIQSFSRDEKKRSDARDRMRRYRQRQREGQAKAAAGASHNEMAGCMPDERLQGVNGQACETGYVASYGRAEWDCVQHDEQVGAILDEKMQNINEPTPETEPAASYGGTAVDYRRNGMKTVAVTDKKRLRAHGQAQQTGYTVPYGKAALDFVQHNEQVGAILDEKMQNINEPIPETEYAASCGGADLTCTQLSERQELAAYDGDDIDCMQGEETDEGISYVAEDMVYAPCAGSAADYLDVGQDTCGDREEPSSPPGGKALLYYEALFGKADRQTAEALQGLARRWGDEAVCRAICIALKKGESSVPYIRAVLVHCKGNPRHDTAPSPYERERSMPSGQGGLRHISDRNWGSPDVSLGEGICPVYEALP
jgi:predicted phage replisome organizer